MKLTKKVDFCAAHSIQGAGKCANKHGHNWEATIDVEHVSGEITHEAGFLVDVAKVKQAAYQYDHDDLDKYFKWASTENVAQQIANDALLFCLEANPEAQFYVRVHLVETKNNSADAIASNVDLHVLNDDVNYGDVEVPQENIPEPERQPGDSGAIFKEVGLVGARQNEPEEKRKQDFLKDRVASAEYDLKVHSRQLQMPIERVRDAKEVPVDLPDNPYKR